MAHVAMSLLPRGRGGERGRGEGVLQRNENSKARAEPSSHARPARLLAAGAALPLDPGVHLGPYDKCAGTEPL